MSNDFKHIFPSHWKDYGLLDFFFIDSTLTCNRSIHVDETCSMIVYYVKNWIFGWQKMRDAWIKNGKLKKCWIIIITGFYTFDGLLNRAECRLTIQRLTRLRWICIIRVSLSNETIIFVQTCQSTKIYWPTNSLHFYGNFSAQKIRTKLNEIKIKTTWTVFFRTAKKKIYNLVTRRICRCQNSSSRFTVN